MEEKFIYCNNEDKNIYSVETVKGEKYIYVADFKYNSIDIRVLITQPKKDSNNEEYYNVYILNDSFQLYPLNCLHEQIPLNIVKDKDTFFNRKFCEFVAIEHYLWFKYGNPSKDKVLSFAIEEYE